MKRAERLQLLSVVLAFLPGVANAQTATPSATLPRMLPAPGGPSADSGADGALAFLLLLAVVLVVCAAIAKAIDFRIRREEERVELQGQIGDALLEDRAFDDCIVTPTVHVPYWAGFPPTIAVSGAVPSSRLEQRALAVAAQVASKLRPDFSIVNRMAVVPSSSRCAA